MEYWVSVGLTPIRPEGLLTACISSRDGLKNAKS
jgi:hypothetical protein